MSDADVVLMRSVSVGDFDPEIIELEARLRAAQLTADVDALAMLISNDLLFTGPDGRLGTKAHTRVWAREGDGRWRVVGGHVSEVPGGH